MSRVHMIPRKLRPKTTRRDAPSARLFRGATLVLSFVVLALLGATSCSSEQPGQPLTPGAIATTTPTVLPSATSLVPGFSPTPGSSQMSLRVWVSPEFGSPATVASLNEIVAEFETAFPGIRVEVSPKRDVGKGGLLDLLQGASQVAPGYLPDLVLMDDRDATLAAERGLLNPLDSLLSSAAEDYVFANLVTIGVTEGTRQAIPFAMDFLHLAYRVPITAASPMSWAGILESGGRYLFASGASENYNSDSILVQYLGLDGALADASGKPTLDSRILTRVFDSYSQMADMGVLAPESLTANSPSAVWGIYKMGEATFAEVWASQYKAEALTSSDTTFARIPTRNGRPATLAHVWAWSITARTPERQQIAASFLEWVLEPSRQRTWSQAAGLLPATPKAWPLPMMPTQYSQFLLGLAREASLFPVALHSAEVSAALQETLSQVITAGVSPKQAAEQAVAKMKLQ